MINQSEKPIAYWLIKLKIRVIEDVPGRWIIVTDLSQKDAAALMQYGGWHLDRLICGFRNGILCEIEYGDTALSDQVIEISNYELAFDSMQEAMLFLLGLYDGFSLEWEEKVFNESRS